MTLRRKIRFINNAQVVSEKWESDMAKEIGQPLRRDTESKYDFSRRFLEHKTLVWNTQFPKDIEKIFSSLYLL